MARAVIIRYRAVIILILYNQNTYSYGYMFLSDIFFLIGILNVWPRQNLKKHCSIHYNILDIKIENVSILNIYTANVSIRLRQLTHAMAAVEFLYFFCDKLAA